MPTSLIDPIAKLLGGWALELNIYTVILRLGLTLALSAVLGCERSSKRHAAGLRTFMVVALSTTIAMPIPKHPIMSMKS